MSSIFSTILFASAAAAQITTSIWLPAYSYSSDEDRDFRASIVAAEDDRVTMAIVDASNGDIGETLTFHGSTAFENVLTTSGYGGDFEGELTMSYGCSKRTGTPICVFSSNGPAVWSQYCQDFTSYVVTETYTFDSPPSTVEQVNTYDLRASAPEFCLTGSLLPESFAAETMSLSGSLIQTYAVTITAGEQKLSATAGSTPTNNRASSTTTSSGGATPTTSTSSSSSNVDASGSTPSPTAPVAQSTNAAPAPIKTFAPALAGLGALVAAIM